MRRILFLALAPLLFALPALAETSFTIPSTITFDGTEGIEADIAGRLNGTVANGVLSVHPDNPEGGQKVAYTREGGPIALAADVRATFGPAPADDSLLAGPGIVIRHNDDTQSYYFLILTSDGYAIRSVVNGTFAQALTGSLPDGVDAGGVVRLGALEKSDGGAEFFVNGQSVGSINDSGVDGRGFGLIHLGAGTFTFDNVASNTKGQVPDSPAATPPADIGPTPQPDNPPSPPSPTPQVSPPATLPPPPPPPAAVPPPLPTIAYYIGENGKPVGPLTIPDLMQRMRSGTFARTSLVWKEGMAAWQPAESLPELKLLFEMQTP